MVTSRRTRAVKRPQRIFRFDADREWLSPRAARSGSAKSSGVQVQAVDGGRFARHAVVVHGVDAVGGDVHLVERAVAGAEIVDAFDGDAAQREVFGELARRRRRVPGDRRVAIS